MGRDAPNHVSYIVAPQTVWDDLKTTTSLHCSRTKQLTERLSAGLDWLITENKALAIALAIDKRWAALRETSRGQHWSYTLLISGRQA